MWEAQSTIIDNNNRKFSLLENGVRLEYAGVIQRWQENREFRDFYFSILREAPFDAFFWEHPPVTHINIKDGYEFVLVNSTTLSSVQADPSPFQEKFYADASGRSVIAFQNLGGDAELIVPCLLAARNVYAHFASFV